MRNEKTTGYDWKFYPNGDVNRLYIPRSEGVRGLKSVVRIYESRIV